MERDDYDYVLSAIRGRVKLADLRLLCPIEEVQYHIVALADTRPLVLHNIVQF